MTVNKRFKEVIEVLNKNTNSLASELKVSHSAIARVLKGETMPSSKILIPMGQALGVSIDWLLFGVGQMLLNSPIQETKEDKKGLSTVKDDQNNQYYSKIDYKKELDILRKEIEAKNLLIAEKNRLIESKDKVINLLEKTQK
jgi:transcriptional regulator with XRE-family HTH domain